ncbi:MAG TPA: hypothetical protein VGC21_06805 [Telluria sp.]|jgi:hypothetical protein
MNLQDQVIHRCIHAACARPLPRRVNFCPYCGTGQHAGVVKPSHVLPPVPPAPPVQSAPAAPPAGAAAPAAAAPAAAPAPAPVQAAHAAPVAAPAAGATPGPPPRGLTPPPKREPVRLRWWLVALAALWAIWLYARPSPNKIEARIERATLASAECRMNDAQSELIALRMTRASPEQLARLQATINAASAGCARKKQRVKAWEETTIAVENALSSNDFARAQTRLSQFTKRYSEDEDTQRLKDKIAKQRAAAPPPPEPAPVAAPSAQPSSQQSQSVRNLIDEAERALAAGDYRAASDKLEVCMTMVDPGNRECAAFKVHADRMQREQRRCVLEGRQWVADRCR